MYFRVVLTTYLSVGFLLLVWVREIIKIRPRKKLKELEDQKIVMFYDTYLVGVCENTK
jgi:hypothetical protein